MSRKNIGTLKAHFLNIKEFNNILNPSTNELWFVKMPHWLKYAGAGCLSITTQPTTSGSEIDFYSGASFVVHCGKYADGTNNNMVVEITSDKYVDVSSYSDGSYCFDSSGNMVVGSSITYDSSTNLVSVDGVSGNYSQPIQTFTYDSSMNEVTLNGTVSVKGIGGGGGGGAEYITDSYDTNIWAFKVGNVVIQGGSGSIGYGDYSTSVYFPVPMSNASYSTQLVSGSYYQPYVSEKYTTSMTVYAGESYDTVNFAWFVIGEC